MDVLARIHGAAKAAPRHVVLPEGTEPRTLQAAARATALGLARVTLIGPPDEIRRQAASLGVSLAGIGVAAVPTGRDAEPALRAYLERVARRGITADEGRAHMADPLLWAASGVAAGQY